ncbi:hypothetical protein GGF32_003590 [Allomyces javanicus]|nr:hypothetical protein GGF32_003590 [Allomyces javanicus]
MSGLELPAAGAMVAAVKFTYDAVRDKRMSNESSAKQFTDQMKTDLEALLAVTPSVTGDRSYGCSKLEASKLVTGSTVAAWTNTGYIGRATAVAVLSSGVHVCCCGHKKGWGHRIRQSGCHAPTKKSSLSGGSTLSRRGDYVLTDQSEANIAKALRDCLDHSIKNSKGKPGVVLQSQWCCSGCATEYARELEIRYVVA